MKSALEILCEHAAATLPDSLRARQTLLAALARLLKTKSAAGQNVHHQLAALETITRLQTQLPRVFPPANPHR